MRDFDIWLDTTADLEAAITDEYGIRMMPAHISIEGVETDSFLSWDTVSREDFYARLKADPSKFKTAPPSLGEMSRAYEQSIAEGKDVIYICLSGGLSGTVSFARQARDMTLEAHPDARIEIVDSLRFGPAIGLMAVNAAIRRNAGGDLDTVLAYLEKNKNRYHQAGWLDDLSFVVKQGRLTHSKAFFGTLIGIKPIGEFDYNGLTTVLGKAKGEKAAFAALIHYVRETIENPEEQIVFVAQTNRRAQAEKYRDLIEREIHPKAVLVKDVYPSCGINVGPGLMAAYYVGTPISSDLEAEKQIIKDSLEGKA